MKSLFFLSLLLLHSFTPPKSKSFLDPTGTYILKGRVRNNNVISHSGEIRVKLLEPDKLAFCLYLNKGYPRYESGALLDTVTYDDNTAVCLPLKDSSCSLVFRFTRESVEIVQFYNDPRSDCGCAPGVLIAAIFEKTSAQIPVIQDLSGHGAW